MFKRLKPGASYRRGYYAGYDSGYKAAASLHERLFEAGFNSASKMYSLPSGELDKQLAVGEEFMKRVGKFKK